MAWSTGWEWVATVGRPGSAMAMPARRHTAPMSGPSVTVFDEMMATGAVIAGRRTFDREAP